MELYFLLTGMGALLFIAAVVGLVWMVKSGQADDLETPALRMLGEDPCPPTDRPARSKPGA